MSAVLKPSPPAAALHGIHAVLFDLDGTLVDSAPDLAAAANDMRAVCGLEPLAYELLRPMVGSGARGMVGVAFQVAPGQPAFEALKHEFLDRYESRMLEQTRLFAEVELLLRSLSAAGIGWGIVTNKAERFALPLTRVLGLDVAALAVVGGDTTPHTKPHPAPLLEAARRAGIAPAQCIYVGDDERDITAGRAAGMRTAAAAWGYLGKGAPINAWGADIVLSSPSELLQALGTGLNYAVLGPTRFRRGCGSGVGHAEHQFARKTTGNKVTANDSTFALAA